MRDNHRRYWGEMRHNWYRENRGRHQDGGRYRGRGRGYSDNIAPGAIGWPERNGGRVRDGDDNRRGGGDGRRGRSDQWRGGEGQGADAVPTPNPEMVHPPGRGRQRGDGNGCPNWRRNDGLNAVPMPQPVQPGMRQGDRGERVRGGSEGRGYRQPPSQDAPAATQSAPPAPRAVRPPRPERPSPRPGGDRMEQVDGQ